MKPSRNSACAVVSNGMRESSHVHRSFATGSSIGFGAALVVMKFLRARYSSTTKSRPGPEDKARVIERLWAGFLDAPYIRSRQIGRASCREECRDRGAECM